MPQQQHADRSNDSVRGEKEDGPALSRKPCGSEQKREWNGRNEIDHVRPEVSDDVPDCRRPDGSIGEYPCCQDVDHRADERFWSSLITSEVTSHADERDHPAQRDGGKGCFSAPPPRHCMNRAREPEWCRQDRQRRRERGQQAGERERCERECGSGKLSNREEEEPDGQWPGRVRHAPDDLCCLG